MIFRIQNAGPLRDVSIDLAKPLVILTGPNNSGKTYLAWSIYGLQHVKPSNATLIPALERCIDALLESEHHQFDLATLSQEERQALLAPFGAALSRDLHLCFAAKREQFAEASITLTGEAGRALLGPHGFWTSSWQPAGEAMAVLAAEGTLVGLTLAEDFKASLEASFIGGVARTNTAVATLTAIQRRALRATIGSIISRSLPLLFFGRSVIFPAERIAVNLFARELSLKRGELVDALLDAELEGNDAVPMDLVRRNVGRYPWPIRDALRTANDLAALSKKESPFADLAAELESGVVGGNISVTSEGEIAFTPRSAPQLPLSLQLTASVVKSLASLVFYLRHLARHGDFLIIDEPELNLHPDNQRKLARLIAKLIRRGFRVLLSTHSDVFLRELNHMIMLSALPVEEQTALGYDPACALPPDDVGVYLFDEHTARALPITETGFAVRTIDDEMNALNADTQRLYARLLDKDAPRAGEP